MCARSKIHFGYKNERCSVVNTLYFGALQVYNYYLNSEVYSHLSILIWCHWLLIYKMAIIYVYTIQPKNQMSHNNSVYFIKIFLSDLKLLLLIIF